MDVCGGRAEPLVGIEDGRQALALAEAAIESARSGRAVRV
jgi:predicted dehydrogenase